ncbi:hypothetical protein BDY19DRAFT_998850 [Irpex rosettiformis]|uniref:Uncharacterized protein n=1 Tax=Irpex rosettiformis TaxID=378272 RepID=A0ACB8TM86_9APHY|nr:hypothetical protein BDY19DRAFT_998850 [Irpex rosettiformis]
MSSSRLPSTLVLCDSYLRSSTSNAANFTTAQKRANTRKANREAQQAADEALVAESLNKGPRSTMIKAKEAQDRFLWIGEETKKRRRGKSNAIQQPANAKVPKKAKAIPSQPQYDDIQDDEPSRPATHSRKRADMATLPTTKGALQGQTTPSQPLQEEDTEDAHARGHKWASVTGGLRQSGASQAKAIPSQQLQHEDSGSHPAHSRNQVNTGGMSTRSDASRAKVATQSQPTWYEDDEESGVSPPAPRRSRSHGQAGSARASAQPYASQVSRVDGKSAPAANAVTSSKPKPKKPQQWAMNAMRSSSVAAIDNDSDDSDDAPPYPDSDGSDSEARHGSPESAFVLEQDDDGNEYQVSEAGAATDSSSDGDAESDSELEYATVHGITGLSHLKRHSKAAQLFDTDENVMNARNIDDHPSQNVVQLSKTTHYERKLQSEEATWSAPKVANVRSGSTTENTGKCARGNKAHNAQEAEASEHAPSVNWPEPTRICMTGSGNLTLALCSPWVRQVFHEALDQMKLHVVLENAYEDTDPCNKAAFLMNILLTSANDLGRLDVIDRLHRDKNYSRVLIEALSTRFSQFRGKFKTAAASKIVGHFQLTGGTAVVAQKIEELLEKKCYIYPEDKKHKLIKSKPYGNGIIVDVIQEVLVSKRKSFMADYSDEFEVQWDGETQSELPQSLIALSATAVHAALIDCRTRGSQMGDFSAEQYSGVYETHIEILITLEKAHPSAYHQLLQQLFKDASQCESAAAQADVDEVLEDLDLDGFGN